MPASRPTGQRRLAAILVVDVVGFTRLMALDEAGTVEALKERRRTVLEPAIRAHGGRVVKVMGDGALIEFASAAGAVEAALELQRRMAEANAPLPEYRRMMVRIGINLGDVIGEGSDIYGDGVNVAARLEAVAEPGGICVSAKVADEVRGKLPIALEDLGERALKNIDRPVRVFRVKPGEPGEPDARPALALPDKPSIAVLAFENLSGEREQEYFADGMVEEIITALSRFKWLFVIARNSSFTYKGRAVDVKQVGRELGVRYVLEGSVRRAGSRVRITGQLIDASTGVHLWADRFEGALEDIFDLQDQVTSRVVGAISPKLERAEIERAKSRPTEHLDAYDYFLRGMAGIYDTTFEGNQRALDDFYRATEIDANFAAAYGMAARTYAQRKAFAWSTDRGHEVAETERLARRAASLGRDDAVALTTAGIGLAYVVGDLDSGGSMVERALGLNSNFAWAWLFAGWIKVWLGEPEPALERLTQAMRLSPQDPNLFNMQTAAAGAHFFAERYEEASRWSGMASEAQPNYALANSIAAASGALCGRLDEARKALARLRQNEPELRVSKLTDMFPIRRPQDLARLAEGLRRAGLPE